MFEITDRDVIRTSGKTHHPMATFTGSPSDMVAGTVFEITQTELEQADRYETDPAYCRIGTRLLSGREAWVYADARVAAKLEPP